MNIIHFPVRRCRRRRCCYVVCVSYIRNIPSHVRPDYVSTVLYVLRSIPSQTPPAHILYACCMQIIYYAKTERRKPYLVEHAIALSLQNRFAYSVVRAKFPTIHGVGNKHFEIGK